MNCIFNLFNSSSEWWISGRYLYFRGYRSIKFHFKSTLKVNFSEAGVAWKSNWDKGHLGSWNLIETLTLMFHQANVKNTENGNPEISMKDI